MPNNHNRSSKDYLQSYVVEETAAAQLFAVCRFNNNSDKNCIVYNRQTISSSSITKWVLFEIKIRKSTFSRRNLQNFLKNNLENVETDIFREVTKMIFNLSYGGGSGSVEDAYAVISVTYPAGSTCTCKKSNIEFTAEDQSGKVMFAIPESGTWTVSCTDGTNSDSENVTVSQNGAHSVTLEYTQPAPTPTTGNIYAYGGYGAYNYEGGPSVPVIGNSATFSNLAPGTYLVVWVPSPNTGAKYANVTVTAGKTTSIDMTTGSSSQDGGDDPTPTPSQTTGSVTASANILCLWNLADAHEYVSDPIQGYSATWNDLTPGSYSIYCLPTNGAGVSTRSVTVTAGNNTSEYFSY